MYYGGACTLAWLAQCAGSREVRDARRGKGQGGKGGQTAVRQSAVTISDKIAKRFRKSCAPGYRYRELRSSDGFSSRGREAGRYGR